MPDVIGVQYLKTFGSQFFLAPKEKLEVNALCVVEGEYGLQIARVVHPNSDIPEKCLPKNMHPIVRIATGRDHEQASKNSKREKEAAVFCRQKVKEKGLQMKLVDVTYTLDGRKAVFFFTSENRVDFRELVKDLAQAFKVKIEMRQIGVRDEARRLGGVGCCGRALCCATFLKDFSSVSIRMAKEQNVSLNPTKVSGLCGRLMCCLAYEYEGTGSKNKKKKGDENQQDAAGGESGAEKTHDCRDCRQSFGAGEGARNSEKKEDMSAAPKPGSPSGRAQEGGGQTHHRQGQFQRPRKPHHHHQPQQKRG